MNEFMLLLIKQIADIVANHAAGRDVSADLDVLQQKVDMLLAKEKEIANSANNDND